MNKVRILGEEYKSENTFELLVDHLPDMIHAVDENGNIIYANKAEEALLGYSKDELSGMPVSRIYPDALKENIDQGFNDLQKRGFKCGKSTVVAKDGTEIPVQLSSFAVYDDADNFVQTFSVLRDLRQL